MTSKEVGPTHGTARPSASVGPGTSSSVGSPAARAADRLAQRSGSTPTTLTAGASVLAASRMPASSPPPPAGTTM